MGNITALDFGLSKIHIIKDKGVIIVDTGCYKEKADYIEALSKIGIQPTDVGLIILSHGHWDHIARAAELKEITGAPILCHKNAVRALKEGDTKNYKPRGVDGRNFLKLIEGDVPDTIQPIEPDIVIDFESGNPASTDPQSIDLNPYGVAGRIIYTPGHSYCSISVVLDSGEAIVGDMLLTSPFTGKTCLALIAEDEEMLINSIRTLLETVHTFYGGHGGPYTRDEVLALL